MSSVVDHPQVGIGAVIISRREGEPAVVLIRRGQPPLQGQWSLPGGRLEKGERLKDALLREVREETGLEVRVGRLLEVVEIIEGALHYVVLDYACEPLGGMLCAGGDATEVALVPVYDIGQYGVTPAVARVVSRAITDEE